MGVFAWQSLLLLVALARNIATAGATTCADLASKGDTLIPGYYSNIYAAELYEEGSTFTTDDANSPVSISGLPSFCRFGAYFNTSSVSRVQLEVWLPLQEEWNQRFAFVGNGGYSGEVYFGDMGTALSRHKFAVASTDTGHRGGLGDGSFAIDNPESQLDFGYRAVHLSTVFAKNVLREFYGINSQTKKKRTSGSDFYSYYMGCSSGGKQGLKEIQKYPEDYDGVLAGSPAYWWSHLSAWLVQSNLFNAPGSSGYIDGDTWGTIHSGIVSQCDALDGLEDGVISDPFACSPDFTALGLSDDQVAAIQGFYANWTNSATDELIFPGYTPGSEFQANYWWTGTPFGVGPDYFKYSIMNFTSTLASYIFDTTNLVDLISQADNVNPGGINVDNFDISEFIGHNGKLLTYVGLADPLISAGSSTHHYEAVKSALGYDARDSFRLFTVPGMGHCSSAYGDAAVNFGAWAFGGGDSAELDKEHDIVLALIDWVENGNAPETIIASKYINDDKSQGVAGQRPLCPYPLTQQYQGGDSTSASSYTCA